MASLADRGPAVVGGLRVGDSIEKVDGHEVAPLPLEAFIDRLDGEPTLRSAYLRVRRGEAVESLMLSRVDEVPEGPGEPSCFSSSRFRSRARGIDPDVLIRKWHALDAHERARRAGYAGPGELVVDQAGEVLRGVGVQTDDIIVSVDGRRVTTPSALASVLDGASTPILVLRVVRTQRAPSGLNESVETDLVLVPPPRDDLTLRGVRSIELGTGGFFLRAGLRDDPKAGAWTSVPPLRVADVTGDGVPDFVVNRFYGAALYDGRTGCRRTLPLAATGLAALALVNFDGGGAPWIYGWRTSRDSEAVAKLSAVRITDGESWSVDPHIVGNGRLWKLGDLNDDGWLETVLEEERRAGHRYYAVDGRTGALIWDWRVGDPVAPTNARVNALPNFANRHYQVREIPIGPPICPAADGWIAGAAFCLGPVLSSGSTVLCLQRANRDLRIAAYGTRCKSGQPALPGLPSDVEWTWPANESLGGAALAEGAVALDVDGNSRADLLLPVHSEDGDRLEWLEAPESWNVVVPASSGAPDQKYSPSALSAYKARPSYFEAWPGIADTP